MAIGLTNGLNRNQFKNLGKGQDQAVLTPKVTGGQGDDTFNLKKGGHGNDTFTLGKEASQSASGAVGKTIGGALGATGGGFGSLIGGLLENFGQSESSPHPDGKSVPTLKDKLGNGQGKAQVTPSSVGAGVTL